MENRGRALFLWSVPRARSTAFERMMFERQDHLTFHEPFSRVCDFGVSQVCETSCTSQAEVMAAIDAVSASQPTFVKDTLDFRFDEVLGSPDFLRRHQHAVMIREPREAVASYLRLDPEGTSKSVGFGWLAELACKIEEVTGDYPHVVEAASLMADPRATVQSYCEAMGIQYLEEALDFRLDPPASWQTTERWHDSAASTTALGNSSTTLTATGEVLSGPRLAEIVSESMAPYSEIRSHRSDVRVGRG